MSRIGRLLISCLVIFDLNIVSINSVVVVEKSILKAVAEVTSYGTDKFYQRYTSIEGDDVQQYGQIKTLPDGRKIWVINGYYGYIDFQGFKRTIQFISDENGYRFRVIGVDLPYPQTIHQPFPGSSVPPTIRPPMFPASPAAAPAPARPDQPNPIDGKLLNILVG